MPQPGSDVASSEIFNQSAATGVDDLKLKRAKAEAIEAKTQQQQLFSLGYNSFYYNGYLSAFNYHTKTFVLHRFYVVYSFK